MKCGRNRNIILRDFPLCAVTTVRVTYLMKTKKRKNSWSCCRYHSSPSFEVLSCLWCHTQAVCFWSSKWILGRQRVERWHWGVACNLLALYINGHSKMGYLGCVLFPKMLARCHCKINGRIFQVKMSFLIQISQPIRQVLILRTDPILLGQGVFSRHLPPKAGGVLPPPDPAFVTWVSLPL